ncbi:MAG: energy transducer TonB [Alphaproteobacteria bacterium]
MRRSVVWSVLLHTLVVVLAIVGLPHLWDTTHVSDTPMIVEMVKIDEKTAAKDMPKPEPPKKTPPKKAPVPPDRPKTADIPPPPEPPRIAETPEPKAEKVPVPTPEPPKKKEPKQETKAKPKPPSPPRAIAKARPKRKPAVPKEDFLQSVLRDVSPEDRGENQEEKKEKKDVQPQPAKKEVQNRAPLDAVATMSEIDAIRHRIEQCWNIPAGAREADKLIVSIRVWVNPDGTVRDARILDQARLSDTFFRTAAESALRAVLNPRCSPLPIPINKYEQFKEMVLDFNPKLATGS